MSYKTCGTPVRLSATGAILTQPGRLVGILCSASTAGTIILYDGLSAVNALTGTITLVTGGYTPFPIALATGLWAVIGGTLDATFIVN
jgi:hypothetical protein